MPSPEDQNLEQYLTQNSVATSASPARFDDRDYRFMAVSMAAYFYLQVSYQTRLTFLFWLIGFGFSMYRWFKGRTFYVFGHFWFSLGRRMLGGLRWSAQKPTAAVWWAAIWLILLWSIVKRQPIWVKIVRLGRISLLYDEIKKTDSFVVVVDGSRFADQDLAGQRAFVQKLANIARQVTYSQDDFTISAAFGISKRPLNRAAIARRMVTSCNPIALDLAMAAREGEKELREARAKYSDRISDRKLKGLLFTGQSMLADLDLSERKDREITMFTTWTIKRSKAFRLASKSGSLAEDEVNESAVMDLVTAVLRGLNDVGIVNPRVLDLAGMRAFVHSILNVTRAHEYYNWALHHPLAANELPHETRARLKLTHVGTDAELETKVAAETSPHWAQYHIYEHKDHSIIDDTETTYIILTGQEEYITPDFWRALDRAPGVAWYDRIEIGETINSKFQVLWMNLAIPLFNQLTSGLSTDIIQVQDQQDKLKQRQVMAFRTGYTTDYSQMLAVSGMDTAERKRAVKVITGLATDAGLKTKVLKGRSYQLKASLSRLGVPQL